MGIKQSFTSTHAPQHTQQGKEKNAEKQEFKYTKTEISLCNHQEQEPKGSQRIAKQKVIINEPLAPCETNRGDQKQKNHLESKVILLVYFLNKRNKQGLVLCVVKLVLGLTTNRILMV